MKILKENRSHRNVVYALGVLPLLVLGVNAVHDKNPQNSTQGEVSTSPSKSRASTAIPQPPEQPLTLKTDPITGQVHFDTKTVDINVLNRQKDRENAEKVAIIQKDLQSRIKVDADSEIPLAEKIGDTKTEDPAEILRKQVQVKEDIESRIVLDDEDRRYRVESEEYYEDYKNPIKRADVEYYEDEAPMSNERPMSLPQRMTTEAPKEEESFFSIFESLFGSNDEESQSKKNKVEEKQAEEINLKQNIKTVGDILKPIRTHEEMQMKTGYGEYDEPQEYRIINEYPQKQGFRPSEQGPYQYQYQRPNSVKPYQQYRPYPTPGYEDYDIEEFVHKNDDKSTTEMLTTPKVTPVSTTTTTTTAKTFYSTNRPKPPVAEKKSDYVGKTSQISKVEKVTEKGTYFTTEPSTEKHLPKRPEYETQINEVKPEKIQESPNFYNLINLPVRYSTKDTAIPLISTSYANTKIQGMGAHKYDKTQNGKYPNHKYDSVSNTRTPPTTRRPSYWSARRTTTQATATPRTTPSVTRSTPSSTYQSTERTEFGSLDYDDLAIGSSANFGGYGNKAGATKITETKVPYNKNTETTTRRAYVTQKDKEISQQDFNTYKVQKEKETIAVKKTEYSTPKPAKEVYDTYEYEYESFPAVVQEVKPPKDTNIKLHSSYSEQNKFYESQSESSTKKIPHRTNNVISSTTETVKVEPLEYEYYDYETEIPVEPSTSTTTTTTPKYRVKFPSFQKDKIKTTTEKVAVVVPSNNKDYFLNDIRNTPPTSASTSPKQVSTSSTTTTTPVTTTKLTSTTGRDPILSQETNLKGTHTQFYRPKEPAPVFEENDESDEYTPRPISIHIPRRTTTERPTTQVKPIVVTATKKDQENNVNIVLVPMKDPQKEAARPEETTKFKTEKPSTVSVHTFSRPNEVYHPNFDYTTEFTVGAVHGHGSSVPLQGHFVASSISANPYEDDEPFRPIPKPPGLSTSFQVVADQDDLKKPQYEIQTARPEKRPPPQLNFEESEPIHEPHEFIPSPQFHRPGETKISNAEQTGASEISVDYDFDGIQTEPKPGQYVIFSKPQLNPELNEGQLKKKPDIITSSKISNVPNYHESAGKFGAETQKQAVYTTKAGQYYTGVPDLKPSTSEKPELKRPNYQIPSELLDERLSLSLVPPKGFQTEKPSEGNFVTLKNEKQESAANYPRPHWEKNGKPAFLLNSLASKNELNGNRPPPLPPQMAPTLIPPSSAIPQRFRKPPPPPPHPPIRKNFNEGTMSTKPKPNLPNILPQFRPNAKIGTGPYPRPFYRPQGFMNANRRNGPNRYHEKDGNFPYHIHHPAEKDALMHREFEVEADIYPKFITNRGKIPSELLEPHTMHKRYGGGPPNISTRQTHPSDTESPTFPRRLQRTPVTTLQMLKQTPGVQTHKNPVLREDAEDPSIPMVPPVYQPYKDSPSTENVHVVYPSNIQKSRYPVV